MFERFTADARDVVVAAQLHARRHGHPRIGTSHLLLAVVDDPGIAGTLLREHGVTTEAADAALVALLSGQGPVPPTPPGPDDAQALAALGIDLEQIRAAMDAAFGPGALERAARTGRRGRRFGLPRRPPSYDTAAEITALSSGDRVPSGHIPFSPDGKKALELSLREALRLGDGYIGTEHVLMGLVRGDCVAVGMLTRLGVDRSALRAAIEGRRRRSA